MPGPPKITLTDEHRRRYEAGEVTQAELAADLCVSRQAIHARIKRLGWQRPEKEPAEGAADAVSALNVLDAAASANGRGADGRADGGAETRSAQKSDGAVYDPYRDMREPTHRLCIQLTLRILQEVSVCLTRTSGQNAPQSLKRHMETISLATSNLGRLGMFYDPNAASESLTTLRIEVMSEEEEAAVRAQAELDYRRSIGDDGSWEDAERGDASPRQHAHLSQLPDPDHTIGDYSNDDKHEEADAKTCALPVDVRDGIGLRLWLEGAANCHGRRFLRDLCARCGFTLGNDGEAMVDALIEVGQTQPARLEGVLRATQATWGGEIGAVRSFISGPLNCGTGRD